MKKHDICQLLSTSKINMGSVIPAILEHSEAFVLVVTTNSLYSTINRCEFDDMPELSYDILYKEDGTLSDFIQELTDKQIRVGIIAKDSPLYFELLQNSAGGYWITSCRDGIFSYLSDFKESLTQRTSILSFDNDANMVRTANEFCKNSCISVTKGVSHCVCSSLQFDTIHHLVKCKCSSESLLIFPPNASHFRSLFQKKVDIFTSRNQLRFSNCETDYDWLVHAKAIDVNVMHSFLCVMAYNSGYSKGLPINTMTKYRFSDILSLDYVLSKILPLHKQLYDTFLSSNKAESESVHALVTTDFIEYLFSTDDEIICRGINPFEASSITKLAYHETFLRTVNNPFVHEQLERFHKIIHT